ncbi:MAG: hypothetical protein HOP96_05130 [Sphingomonas sp.]|nr:hypothetical protein [Sphingomonas sp.]
MNRSALLRSVAIGLSILVSMAPQRVIAQVQTDSACPSDSKLLNDGPTQVLGTGSGTYWDLVEDGLQSAFGNDQTAKLQYMSGVFGQPFATLDAARDYNLEVVSTNFDKNANGLVCVFDLRGTRAYLRDPYSKFTYFSVGDDKVIKKSNDALQFRSVPGH